MKNYILSQFAVPGAQAGSSDSFVSLGNGIEVALPPDAKNGDSWEIEVVPLKTDKPLASTILGPDVFVSNSDELLSVIRGNLLVSNNTTAGSFDFREQSNIVPDYRSDKIATYFNHIFIAIGRTLYWTDLDNYWNWYPSTDSEADFRIIEWENHEITALCVLNETLYVHFPTGIYECVYTGKPTIVRILKRVTGAGSINSRCVQVTKNALFFLGPENFYIWSVDIGLKEIGSEVWKKFVTASPDPSTTWSYHDARNHEICWVNNGIIWAFNYVEGHWQKYSADGAVAHSTAPWMGNFHAICEDNTCSEIEPNRYSDVQNLWVGCWGVAREAVRGDGIGKMLPMGNPYLETDDLTYGDIHATKSTDVVHLDAELCQPYTGIRVLVAGKKRVSEPTIWKDSGVWEPTLTQMHRDFVEVSGRSLRYRFELVDNSLRADGSVTLNGGQQLNGIRVDSLDGSIKLDGSSTPHALSESEVEDDGRRWFAEIYAWGERVNLPEELVGPDK